MAEKIYFFKQIDQFEPSFQFTNKLFRNKNINFAALNALSTFRSKSKITEKLNSKIFIKIN